MISWNEILCWVFYPAFDEMRFYIFKLEFFLKEIDNESFVHTVLAGIHIGRDEATLWERVNTNVTLCDDNKSTPSARVLDMIIWNRDDDRLHKRAHTERIT